MLLLGLSVGSLLAVAEVGLRATVGPPVQWIYPQEAYLLDPELGQRLRPKQRAYTHDKLVETNSLGLRDREYESAIPPGRLRILAIGDSQTFGAGLELGDTWPKQLERILNQKETHRRWEVINAGVPGTDTWQHEIMLSRLLSSYKTNAVILAVYLNDITTRPVVPSAPPEVPDGWKRVAYALKRSALVTLTIRAWTRTMRADAGERELSILRGIDSPRTRGAWAQVERSISSMRSMTERAGARFILVVLPRRDQVSGAVRDDSYNEKLRLLANTLGLAAIDTTSHLTRAMPTERNLFIPWDGHNSGAANKIIAEELSPVVENVVRPAARP